MTQEMANAKMRDYEPTSDDSGYVPVDAVFSAPAPALEGVSLGERLRLFRMSAVLLGLGGVTIALWPRLSPDAWSEAAMRCE